MKVGHLINPFRCKPDNASYLYYAQPITFESMYRAQKLEDNVELFAVGFDEDYEILPDYFTRLPALTRSTLDFGSISNGRKLPFVQDMLDAIKKTDIDVLVFTNVDIGVQENFYKSIKHELKRSDSFTIHRRDNIPKSLKSLDEIYKHPGEYHKGHDCFIIKRELLSRINLGDMFVGFPPWGQALVNRLKFLDPTFRMLKFTHLTFHIGKDELWRQEETHPLWKKNINLFEDLQSSS